jgi:hypothetical protein
MEMKNEIEALLIEREGYVQRGLAARVAQVDAALRAYGVEVEETTMATPVVERAVKKRAKKRGE